MITVKTNHNKTEPFDIEKIRKVIGYACEGLNVNPIELETRCDVIFYDGISTSEIQQNLIQNARQLISPKALDWNTVAGRLYTMDVWKKVDARIKSFSEYLSEQITSGVYNHSGLYMYSDCEVQELGEYIQPYRDFDWGYGAALVAYTTYLHPKETIHWACMVNAMIIASVERQADKLKYAKKFYDAFSLREISLATPWWINLRHGGSVASCFISQPNDNLTSLSKNWQDIALISQSGGGEGVDMSKVRPKLSDIRGVPNLHQGVTPWIKIINDVAIAVDQAGKRKGVVTVHLPIWHLDIEDFFDIQKEGTGDHRKKAFDIFPQVGLHDRFLKEVDSKGDWYTFNHYEVKQKLGIDVTELFDEEFNTAYDTVLKYINSGVITHYKKYDARELMVLIIKTIAETGMPYIAFRDAINRENPNSHDGNIYCVNLCTESFSNFKADYTTHTCSLASVVLASMKDLTHVRNTARLATRILDNGLLLTVAPIKESQNHIDLYRTIGVGIMGMHDWVSKQNISFDTRYHDQLAEVQLNIQIGCMLESVELAKLRGEYLKFEGSKWHTGVMIDRFIDRVVNSSISDSYIAELNDIQTSIDMYGIRNSQLTSPAPNGTTSTFNGATPGVMPNYASFYLESKSYTGDYYVFGRYANENPLSYDRSISRYNQSVLAKYIGSLQRFCDTGISAEYLFDFNQEGSSVLDIYNMIMTAWKSKCKSIYYIRFIKIGDTVNNILNSKESVCLSCEG